MTSPNANDWTPLSPRSLNITAYLAELDVSFKPPVIQNLLDPCTSLQAVERVLAMPAVRSGLQHMRHLTLPACRMHPSDLEMLHINATTLQSLRVCDDPTTIAELRKIGAFANIVHLTIVSSRTLSAEAAAMVLSYEHLQHLDLQCDVTREQLLRFCGPWRPLHVKLQRFHPLLWTAVVNPDQELLSALHSVGADINQCDENKMTLLTAAVAQDKLEAIPQLLAAGAGMHVSDGYGFTPIAWAALRGNEAALRMLVGLGADIHRLDPHGRSPLELAIRVNALAATRYLVSMGADVRRFSERGSTPLIEAALHGDLDLVRFLVGAGADPHMADKRGLTPATHASLAGKASIGLFLEKRL